MFTCEAYYTPAIIKLIDALIEDGYTSYRDLRDIDKYEISAQCIQALGDEAYSCIIESPDFNSTLSHFKKYLLSVNNDDAIDLAEMLRENAINYFSEAMDSIFISRCTEIRTIEKIETGFFRSVDHINGEIEWRRSA